MASRPKAAKSMIAGEPKSQEIAARRTRISQTDIPGHDLEDALRVARAIFENYAGRPTKPLDVAKAMDLSPTSSGFRMITGASIAYGLTEGASNAELISLTSLGKKILAPLDEGQDHMGKVEAFLRPKVISDFCAKYNNAPVPREDIAINVLVTMGVPRDRATEVLRMITDGANGLGLITEIKGKRYINLDSPVLAINEIADDSIAEQIGFTPIQPPLVVPTEGISFQDIHSDHAAAASTVAHKLRMKRVFITHGKNTDFIEPVKKLLAFGEMEAIVSVERQSISQPVPDKVMADMRSCGAAIIHVEDEKTLIDKDANPHVILNPNVLIEIGAAMALYGRRFILLVKDGTKLPSNLQGLFEVRYSGERLDGDATIRLLEAIREFKEVPLVS
jgi:predicted nucleotide-binding protein